MKKVKGWKIVFESGKAITMIATGGESREDIFNEVQKLCFKDRVIDVC